MKANRETDTTIISAIAAQVWQTFTPNEKNLVRFGMFPAEKMRQYEHLDTRLFACALMDCAKVDGGMRA